MKLALALLCLGSLAACQAQCALEGRVVDQKNGQPLAMARLFATQLALVPIRSSTTEDGRFCFPRLDAGSYQVIAQRTGYLEAVYHGSRQPGDYRLVQIKPEIRLDPLTIEMVPRPILAGRVFDADGAPVGHAEVRASSTQGTDWGGIGTTVYTDNRGAFRLYNLDPGTYHLAALPPFDYRYLGDYRDGTGGPLQERMIETAYSSEIVLEAGSEIGDAVIRMQRVRLRHLSGKVVGIAGAKILTVDQVLSSAGGTQGRNIAIRADGAFYLDGLLPAKCTLHLAGAGDKLVDLTNGDAEGVLIEPRK